MIRSPKAPMANPRQATPPRIRQTVNSRPPLRERLHLSEADGGEG